MERPPEKPDRDFGDKDHERRAAELLDEAIGHAAWEYQRWIGGKRVDAYLHNAEVILEFDGDYWHVHPCELLEMDGPEDLDQRQKKQFFNDLKREHYLEVECGFPIYRLWEDDIMNRPELVKQRVQRLERTDWQPGGRYLITPDCEDYDA